MKYFTKTSLDRLKRKLEQLRAEVRAAGKAVGEAAGMNCDWHDNAPYDEARRNLEFQSGLFRSLSEELADAVVIELREQQSTVAIGTTVRYETDDGDVRTVTIGAAGESLPAEGLMAYSSPLPRSLMGKRVGDSIEAEIGGRKIGMEIVGIDPPSARYFDVIKLLDSDSNKSGESI